MQVLIDTESVQSGSIEEDWNILKPRTIPVRSLLHATTVPCGALAALGLDVALCAVAVHLSKVPIATK